MISYSQGKKKIPAVFLSALFFFFFPLELLAGSLRDNVLSAVDGSKMYCICALTWALEVMLVPLTFLFYISFLCIKYIFVYVVFFPPSK